MPVFESIEIRRRKDNDPAAEGELVCRIDEVGLTLYAGSVFTQNAVAPAIFSLPATFSAPEVSEAESSESPPVEPVEPAEPVPPVEQEEESRSPRSSRSSRTAEL